MKRNNLVFYVGLAAGALHMFAYQLPWPVEFKVSAGLLLIGLGLFVVRKVP
jgi:hypothetical protein